MKKILKMVLIGFVSFITLVPAAIIFIGYSISAPVYSGPESDHFDGRRFTNTGGIKAKGFKDVLRWALNRERGSWTAVNGFTPGEKPKARVDGGLRITYVNHSTFLIQTGGLNILTDPVWSERVSPFSWIGPARMRPPGVRFEDLPSIDVVVLSHNHYDHLDLPTMKDLFRTHKPKIVTPLGVKEFLDKENITGATDLDWWSELTIDAHLTIQAVPAQHFSGRGMFDRDATLWCGYVIKSTAGNIYFAGDTGYHEEIFKEIGRRSGPIKTALIPIGAYKPRWFMQPIHTSPEEAVKIHLDVQSQHSIATHFGTFPLADDGQFDPVNDLEKAKEKYGVSDDGFVVVREGGFWEGE